MRVFAATLSQFREKLLTNQLFAELENNFLAVMGRSVNPSEANAWRNSLPRLEGVLRLANLPDDVHIVLEERIPYFSKRMDVCLFGQTFENQPYSVIIELKGWVEATAKPEGNVETFLGQKLQTEPHPSAQVLGYQEHLEDFRRVYQGANRIGLASCAYCHNYAGTVPDEGLFHPQFDSLLALSPTFAESDAILLAKYLNVRLSGGKGQQILHLYDSLGVGPSKPLIEHANSMMRNQHVFRLLDEQIATNNAIMRSVRNAAKLKQKQVIMVRGGPGTGKSVIALNALGELLRKELVIFLVSGSSAFTNGMRRILGKRVEGLVRFTDFFWNFEPNSIDAL